MRSNGENELVTKSFMTVFLLLVLSACANTPEPLTIDGSSPESTKQSIAQMSKRLPRGSQVEFQIALMLIQWSETKSVTDLIGSNTLAGTLDYENLGSKINGMTYEQILELAEKSPVKAKISVGVLHNKSFKPQAAPARTALRAAG